MKNHLPGKQLIRKVAFFGDANIPKGDPDYIAAFEAARLLAEQGYAVVNGGGPGIMDASTQGAAAVMGESVAVTFAPKSTSSFEGRYMNNLDKVNREIITNDYIRRMFALIENSDVFMIFRGGSGTLSEFGTVWVLANIYFGHHKPFLLYGKFWWEIIDVIHRNLNIDEQEMSCFKIVESKEEALKAIELFEWQMQQLDHGHCRVCAEAPFMT
jgi:uncharacterized protein (TIGR00725 family)